ncbi:Ribonuclease 3 [Komagataella phaffii CBS 7435]|uniref:RNAase III n=2 Tax=Komagataella phaffii TaxID=460519 RepID=C4R6X9_KOMPG|nr:RNAase III [Komagataella phaffii GS115]AOA65248.1 GQ67_04436T0 [Komagataella phaffii]CAH2451301.1 Ribonuclease 3 [Komagataella phaffii CBS 7435]AOA70198.1 GQ68_04408T0 [Komagataella phaffii GS115]CAY71354.1 RNAase III [Komagataella phaffii GS115]CCA41040.1 Ribonuclease 3 [Komagataella phaffii CBS 7435]
MSDEEGKRKRQKTDKASGEEKKSKKKTKISLVQCLETEYAVNKLTSSLKEVLEVSPSYREVAKALDNLGDYEAAVVLALTRGPKLVHASKLKTLYKHGKLDFLNLILNFNDPKVFAEFEDLESKYNKKKSDNKSGKKDINKPSNEDEEGKEVRPKGVEQYPPPLLPLTDPVLRSKVFTHKSAVTQAEEDSIEAANSSYERLEYLGDAVLELAVTSIVMKEFPASSEGHLSVCRQQIVSNSNLENYSKLYGFPEKLSSLMSKEETDKNNGKIYADIFEAYIGALYVQNNNDLTMIQEWLGKLARPVIEAMKMKRDKSYLNKSAKEKLYALIGSAKSAPKYVTLDNGPARDEWLVQVEMEGEIIGKGIGGSVKDARTRAAMAALENHNAIRKYNTMRSTTLREESLVKAPEDSELQKEVDDLIEKIKMSKNVKNVSFPLRVPENSGVIPEHKGLIMFLFSKWNLQTELKCVKLNDQFETTFVVEGKSILTSYSQHKKRSNLLCYTYFYKNLHILKLLMKEYVKEQS